MTYEWRKWAELAFAVGVAFAVAFAMGLQATDWNQVLESPGKVLIAVAAAAARPAYAVLFPGVLKLLGLGGAA